MMGPASPRMRGGADLTYHHSPLSRVVPVCAGMSPLEWGNPSPGDSRPRVCGNEPGAEDSNTESTTWSPRVRE